MRRHSQSANQCVVLVGCSIEYPTQDIAALLGCQRTTVNAAAAELKKVGAIRYLRGVIRVADVDVLRAHACECYGLQKALLQ